jgi:hypothetical protein
MDPVSNTAAATTASNDLKKQHKARKLAKDMTSDECRIESEKSVGRQGAA